RSIRVGIRGVDEALHLWMAIGEVDVEGAALLGDASADMNILGPVTVVVEKGFALVDAILPLCNDDPHLTLGAVKHGGNGCMRRRRAELGEQLPETALADARRS